MKVQYFNYQFWVNYEYLYDAGVKARDPEGQNSTIFVDHREWTFSFFFGPTR